MAYKWSKKNTHLPYGIKKTNITVEHNYKFAQNTLNKQKNRLYGSQTNITNYGKKNKKKTLINKLKSAFLKPGYQNKTLSENTVLKYGLAKEIHSKLNSNNYNNNFIRSILPDNKYKDFENYKKTLGTTSTNNKQLVKNMLHSLLLSNFNKSTEQQLLGALQTRNSLNTTQLYSNNYKKRFLKKHRENMASGNFNNNILRFVSTTDNQHGRLEKIKQQLEIAKSENRNTTNIKSLLDRTKREISMGLGLPSNPFNKNNMTISV